MAVTFLILAVDKRKDPLSEDELAQRYRKGSIIAVRPHTWEWGVREGLPDFVRVTVSGISYKEAAPRVEGWHRQTQWSIVSSDLASDTHVVSLSNPLIRTADGRGGFAAGEVDAFLLPWKATNIQLVNGSVQFTLRIFDALTSDGFWERDVSSVVFSEDSYDQATGSHTITVTIPAGLHMNQAINAIIDKGGDILASDATARTIQYVMARDDVSSILRAQVQRKTLRSISRARYYISPADVDAVVNAGGEINRTKGQFLNALIDSTQ